MSRIRTVKPEFWKHEDLSALPAETHMLAAALLNYSDDEGYFNANPALVKAECSPLRESSVSAQDSLTQLQKIGFIRIGSVESGKRYGQVVNFNEHQRINRPTASKIKALQILWDDSLRAHTQLTETSPPEGKGKEGKGKDFMGELTPAPAVSILQAAALATEFEENFKRLQAIYPKRSGDQRWQTAKKHIRARLKEGATWDEILDGARRYAAWVKLTGKERTETVKQAATFVGTDKAFLEPFEAPAKQVDESTVQTNKRRREYYEKWGVPAHDL